LALYQYSIWWQLSMPSAVRILLLPPIVVFAIITTLAIAPRPNLITRIILYMLSYPVSYALQTFLADKINSLQATRLGADLVPRVKGRWPLNLDVVVSWSKGKEEDVARALVLMEREYGKTYNTRVLGEDQVGGLSSATWV
jgi:hypothetical protein